MAQNLQPDDLHTDNRRSGEWLVVFYVYPIYGVATKTDAYF
jgi:hypothetical protein